MPDASYDGFWFLLVFNNEYVSAGFFILPPDQSLDVFVHRLGCDNASYVRVKLVSLRNQVDAIVLTKASVFAFYEHDLRIGKCDDI
jgi:hypothetical protein